MTAAFNFTWNYEIAGFVSKSQSGKTTLIKKLIKDIPKKNVIVLDTNFEYDDYPYAEQIFVHTPSKLDEFILKQRKQKNKLLIIEDLDIYTPQLSKQWHELLSNASHQRMGILYSTRRVLNLNPLTLTLTDWLIFSKYIPIADKNRIEETINRLDFQIDFNKVSKLPDYSFWCVNAKKSLQMKIK